MLPPVVETRETKTPKTIEMLQKQLTEQQALVQKLEEELAEAQGLATKTDECTEALAPNASKIRVNITVIGHTSSGKLTTTGHLLYKLGAIQNSEMDRVESEAIEKNMQSSKYAWVLDKLQDEREKGIPTKIKPGKFETTKYFCTIIDSPRHRDYLKEMIAGTSQADCAVLIIDSTVCSSEASISKHGQTLELALLASSFGVKQMICCCNKIDATSPPYSRDRYNEIVGEVSPYIKKAGYNLENIEFIPMSAFHGDNLIERSKNTAWYKGHTLFEAFDKITQPKRPSDSMLRIPLRGPGYYLAGTDKVAVDGCVATGILKPETSVRIHPAGLIRTVESLEMGGGRKPLEEALTGDNVTLCFSAKDVASAQLSCGSVISAFSDDPVMEAASFNSKVIIMNHPGKISTGFTSTVYCHTTGVAVKFGKLIAKIDKRTGGVIEHEPKFLMKGEAAIVQMIPTEPMVVETSSASPALGRFVAYENGELVAVGVVTHVDRK